MYGKKPKDLGLLDVSCDEMIFYQYLPIKLVGQMDISVEERLNCFSDLISVCCNDFISVFGVDRYKNNYVYLTAKKLYQVSGYSFNRKGYHSDGFLTDDINYIWSDSSPTIFNSSDFILTPDDNISMLEMESQAIPSNEFSHDPKSLLRLDQFSIHKVSEEVFEGMRTFVKVSFSEDKYDLKGNSKNYLLDYDWEMRTRLVDRNIPQKLL
jgi:hypothetical protein